MSPDQWLASQTEEKPAAALSPDQWLAQQQPAEKEPTKLSPDQWLAQQPVEAKTSNPFKGLVARTASLAGEGVEAVARVAENLGDKLETALPLSNLTPEQIKEEQQLQPLFNWANSLRQYGKEIGYEPSTKLGELPGKPLLVVPFIAERLIASAPDMAAAVVATPAYLVALTNETLNERLANDNKPLEEATIADVTAAAGAAVVQAYLEKFATKALVKGKAGAEGATATRRVGKEAGLQAGTEALEEGAGYLGGTAGTVRGVDAAQLAEQMLEGAIVGGGLGAGVQAGKEYYTKKQRAELADIVRSDLEARGETPTDEQIGAIVDNMIRIQKEESEIADTKDQKGKAYQAGLNLARRLKGEVDETGAGTDTGVAKRGVSVSEETEAGGTAGTTTTSTTGGVGGDQGTSGQPGVGEGTQQSALSDEEIAAKAKEFQDKRAALLTKTGRIPLPNSKKGKEYQALVDEEEAFIKSAMAGKQQAATPLTLQEQQALQDELQQEQSQLNAPSAPQTAEFNEYFKDSKVRDESGQLIPLFHGTTATGEKGEGITQFKLSKEGSLGEGIYLSPKTGFAGEYAEGEGGNILPVFADIRNPLVINTVDRSRDPGVALLEALGMPIEKAEAKMEKAYEDKGGLTKEVITRARKQGYDGIFQYKNGVLSEVVAFSPNQIKSAFNQKPTTRPEILNSSPKADQADADMSRTVHPRVAQAIEANDIQGALKAIKDTAGKFFSEFASRLMELGLNTQISFNQQYALIQNEIKKIEGQQNRVIAWIQTVRPDVYEKHFNPANMLNRFTGMHDSFKALAQGKLGVDPKMFEQDLIDINKVYSNSIKSLQARGTFFVTQNAATFNTVFGGNNNQTVMHEFTHAATHWAINNPTKLNEQQRKALNNLTALFRYAKRNAKNPGHNAYTNLHEFVAEAFSNAEFQKELRQMKSAMGSDMSAWSKFIQAVAKLFGVDNVLFHTLANADVLFSANYGETAVTNTLFAPSSFSVSSKKTFQLNVQERLSFLKSLISGKVKWKDLNKKNLEKFLGTTNQQYRRYLLGGLTLDQITDMVGSDMPQFKQYVKEVDAMINTRNRILAEGDESIKEWSQLLETNPEKATQLGNMMIEATIKKIDPDPQGAGHDAVKFQADADLKKAWAAMVAGPDGPKALKIYRDVRKFYEKRAKEYIAIQLQRIRSREEAKGTDPDEINEIIRKEHQEITKEMIRPYFPIKRFGDYWLQIGKGKSKIFMQFEDAWAREQELEKQKQKLIASGMTEDQANEQLDVGQGFSEGFGQRLADIAHLQKLKDRIDAETDNVIASTDPNVKADEINSLRDALKDNFDQYYMEQLPTQSIQKMFLHRDNISGPSADMLRAFAVSRQRVAYQRARFQHMPQLFDTLEAARMFLKTVPLEERTRLRDYVNELELNLKNAILEPPKQSGLTTGLTQFGFLHFLTSPASAIVNMMAIPGIYIPNAAAKYGMANTTIALAKYNRLLGGTGFRSTTTGRIEFLSLSRAELENHPVKGGPMIADEDGVLRPATLADVYNEGVARGIIDTTLTHEAAAIGEQPANEYTGNWQKFMYYASLPFHSAEKYNRETAFMSSFELAYNKYIEKGYIPQKAYDASLQDARDLTQKTMFNYNTINKPRYFRGDLRNIVLQFKMYPQHMSVLMYKTFHDAIGIGINAEMESYKRSIKGSADFDSLVAAKEAELKDMKREALKAFTGMMGFTFVTAGITGMPLFFVFQGVANAMHALFDDDDEPFDAENWFKNWTNRQFGDFFGDTVSRGLLSQATGMNFADRMGINLTDMWFPDVKKNQDEVQYMQNLMINLMGPTIGAGVNYIEAWKRYKDGYTERAIEVMMPAAIKNVLVGTRYMTEGKALTMKGATLDEEITPAEALAQMLGFSPEDTAKKQKSAIEMKSANEEIMSRHNDLLNAFFIAVDGNSPEDMQRAIEKIMKFNAANPSVAIDGSALYDSVQRRYKDRALANITGGMPINKKLMPYLDGMRDYAR